MYDLENLVLKKIKKGEQKTEKFKTDLAHSDKFI